MLAVLEVLSVLRAACSRVLGVEKRARLGT